MDEDYTEGLRRRIQMFLDDGCPFGQKDNEIIEWLACFPVKVREAILLVIDGQKHQDHRTRVKGAETAARRKASNKSPDPPSQRPLPEGAGP